MAPAFAASADFAIDKSAGHPCPNLRGDFRCGVHDDLRGRGFAGCAVFDCFGAGQRVAQVTFAGRDWRTHPDLAEPMFAVFPVMRQLQELLWYVTEALRLPAAAPVHPPLRAARARTAALTLGDPAELLTVDVAAHRERVNPLLRRAGTLARASVRVGGPEHSGADLIGRDLRRADLQGANLRGALLIGADLRGVDLAGADLTGADLRGADVRGAAVAGAFFVTQAQLDAARGDGTTRLSATHSVPPHWPTAPAGAGGRTCRLGADG